MVSWDDCQDFLDELNRRTKGGYRLPSEAEWEYAARGGRYGRGMTYAGGELLDELGWYDYNSLDETQLVGQKRPNELGLCDLSGNVLEWCQDHWHDSYKGAPADGSAWEDRAKSANRVDRGGSWSYDAVRSRVAIRYYVPGYRLRGLGLRLARGIDF